MTEKLENTINQDVKTEAADKKQEAFLALLEKGKKGKIEIECYSRDELNRLIDLLKRLG